MDDQTRRLEAHRSHLHGIALRMLGSPSDADDAVQEAWLRFRRSDVAAIENLPGWLTTVVARIYLDQLRSRSQRAEEPFGLHAPDPIVDRDDAPDPARELATRSGSTAMPASSRSIPTVRRGRCWPSPSRASESSRC